MKHRRQPSKKSLDQLQRSFAAIIMRPLTSTDRTVRQWSKTRTTASVVENLITPNTRLSALERIEIYNRQYWFRLLDCLYDDFPLLCRVLGTKRFHALSRAYLQKHPSTSYTLRDLGRHLPQFVKKNPKLTGRDYALAHDIARFEWAQIEAFDAPALTPFNLSDLARMKPAKFTAQLQPHVILLDLGYPVDEMNSELRTEGHGAGEAAVMPQKKRPARIRRPRRHTIYLAVHRVENRVYLKRLEREAWELLHLLANGKSLENACEKVSRSSSRDPKTWIPLLKEWFATWGRLGWLCKPDSKSTRGRD